MTELAEARLRALQDAEDEAAERAAAARWRASWASSARLAGGPGPAEQDPCRASEGEPPGAPPEGGRPGSGKADDPAKGRRTPEGVARSPDGGQADDASGRSGIPPSPRAALGLTESEQLSLAIEERRRELLASARDHWETRLWYLEGPRAAYQERALRLAAELDAAELGGLGVRAAELAAELAEAREGWERVARSERYAKARVRSLTSNLGPRLAKCLQERRWLRCGCEHGKARAIDVTCGQKSACAECRRRWSAKARKRLLAALPGWIDKHRDHRGRAGRVRLITLTIEHSGDIARDRAELVEGWIGLRKQLGRWFGFALPYALVWETTPGDDGLGHEHAHIIAIGGPPRWNYSAIQRTWRRVCPRSSHLDIQLAGARKPGRTACDPVKAAAHYLGKYATKGAEIGGKGWSDELIAQVIAAHYGKRGISTSHGFWAPLEPICEACGSWIHRAEAPHVYYQLTGTERIVWGPTCPWDPGPEELQSPLICG